MEEHSHGTLVGAASTRERKAWGVFQALGNIAFAYSFTSILIEIQVLERKTKSNRNGNVDP
jgi:hypothetical protein